MAVTDAGQSTVVQRDAGTSRLIRELLREAPSWPPYPLSPPPCRRPKMRRRWCD